jgi:hypothetical protein
MAKLRLLISILLNANSGNENQPTLEMKLLFAPLNKPGGEACASPPNFGLS